MSHPPTADPRPLKVWLKGSHLIGIGGLLAAIVLTLSLAFLALKRAQTQSESLQQLQQLAKLLARQTATDISGVESLLLVLAAADRALIDPHAPGQLQSLVGSIVRGYPQIRSVSVLDGDRVVVASTSPGNLGIRLDMPLFGTLPVGASKVVMGPILAGRDLNDIQRRTATSPKLNVFPMMVGLDRKGSHGQMLLALVNADFFSSVYEASTGDPSVRAALVGYEGELLVSSSNVTRALGSSVKHLPLFGAFLPNKEWGSYIGPGFDNQQVSTAFSVLPKWPMAVIAESSLTDVMADVTRVEQLTLLAVSAILSLIAALTVATARSLKRHLSINDELYQATRASEARQRAMFDSAIDGILTIDGTGNVVDLNPAAQRIFGPDGDEIAGKPIHAFLEPVSTRRDDPQDRGRDLADRDGAVHQRLNQRIETVGRRSDGATFPIELTMVSSKVKGQQFFTSTVRDIGEQKRIEEEKSALLLKYRELTIDLERQKRALDEHAIVSIEDPDGTIVYANGKLLEISGFRAEELIGKKHYVFRERLNQPEYDAMRSAQALGAVWHGELSFRRGNGGKYWVSNTTVPVPNPDGSIRQFITIQTDITQLRLAERALAQARQRELEIGTRIQQTLLAAGPLQQESKVWLSCFNQASKGIDGDFVEVIKVGEHCVDIIAGDVMGKGVPAALMGAATKLQFSRAVAELVSTRGADQQAPRPIDILSSVHRTMTPHLQLLEVFVTLCYIRIDRKQNTATWVGCGHEESLVITADGQTKLLPNQHPPLGVLQSVDYVQDECAIFGGDALFLCSDGLADAMLPSGERIGRDLINATVRQLVMQHHVPGAALHSLRRNLLHEKVQINDDVSLVLVVLPTGPDANDRCELPLEMNALRPLRDFVKSRALHTGMAEADAAMLEVASVEVFTNIVRHDRGLLEGAPVELLTHCDQGNFVLELIYLGDAYTPPADLPPSDFGAFPEGGFGLTIIRNACDRVQYLHHAGVNTVRLSRGI